MRPDNAPLTGATKERLRIERASSHGNRNVNLRRASSHGNKNVNLRRASPRLAPNGRRAAAAITPSAA
jgi:hypothetical protein